MDADADVAEGSVLGLMASSSSSSMAMMRDVDVTAGGMMTHTPGGELCAAF